jgi:hypothetical protein
MVPLVLGVGNWELGVDGEPLQRLG